MIVDLSATGVVIRAPIVVLFPHAGGSPRFFAHWRRILTHCRLWGVTYPGRDHRLYDELPISLTALAYECAHQLEALFSDGDTAVVLVGHSMGALVAYECAGVLETFSSVRGIKVVVSGQNPPQCHVNTQLHLASDEALIADIKRQNPANGALWEQPELRALFLPVVRDDYRLLETYCPSFKKVTSITVVYGASDNDILLNKIAGWQCWSYDPVHIKTMQGGHFYLASPSTALPSYIVEILSC